MVLREITIGRSKDFDVYLEPDNAVLSSGLATAVCGGAAGNHGKAGDRRYLEMELGCFRYISYLGLLQRLLVGFLCWYVCRLAVPAAQYPLWSLWHALGLGK